MLVLYVASLVAGLLLGVRIMFFGAERRSVRSREAMPLRRSEPAIAAFVGMFGLAGYLLHRYSSLAPLAVPGTAVLGGLLWAAIVVRVAIMMARLTPEHDPEDPRYSLQGHVAVVTSAIPAGGIGVISHGDHGDPDLRALSARSIDDRAIEAGLEVCIERVEDGVAWVEPWAAVESRL